MSGFGNKKSIVWRIFEPLSNDNTKARCKLCKSVLSRGGIGKKATTSSLIYHLVKKHPEEYNEATCDKVSEVSSDSQMAPSTSQGVKRKQETLDSVFEKKRLWDINDKRSVELHNAIAEMIACDNQPFAFVEDEGFVNLMKKAQPQYKVPSREYFKQNVIPSLYQDCKREVSSLLSEAEFVSLTSDIWTSTISNQSFISFTAHWITNDFVLHHAALEAKHFPGSHTGEAISDMFKIVINEWNLNDKIYIVLRDEGANIMKGLRIANLENESCFLHSLHLTVCDALTSQRSINDLIAVGKKIVTHFNHSPLACSRLTDIQINELKIPKKKLVQSVITRWNSTYYMLQRLLEQKNALSLYATKFGEINNLTATQWTVLEKLLNLLKPFEEITKQIASSRSLISEVIPIVTTLKLYLSKSGDFFGVGTMKDTLLQNLEKRFASIQDKEHYSIATVLDPRFKLFFFNKDEAKDVEVKSKLTAIVRLRKASMKRVTESEQNISITIPSSQTQNSLWACFNEIASQSQSEASMENSPQCQVTEISNFFSQPLLEREKCPLKWWAKNSEDFPNLSQLAKKYLSAPGSTIYSERLFSEAGNIYEKKRNRLSPENAELLLFLHHNLRLLKTF